jgi:hypothetical protein
MSKVWVGKTGKVFAVRKCTIELDRVKECIGEPHHIETDPTRTHSGIERYWVFDVGQDLALCFHYLDPIKLLLIGTNREGFIHTKVLERFITFNTGQAEGLMWE